MKTKFLFAVLLILSSCNHLTNSEEENFIKKTSALRIKYDNSVLQSSDSVVLDGFKSSYIGELKLLDNKLCFIDSRLCKIFEFDKDGEFITSKLGRGRAKNELDAEDLTGITRLTDGNYFIVSSIRGLVYNSTIEAKIDEVPLRAEASNTSSINANNASIYSMCYANFKICSYNDNIIYNVSLQHPKLNFIDNTSEFYANAKNIFIRDYKTGKLIKMIGKYPSIYKDGSHSQFSLVNFDVSANGYIYVTYEADYNIYCYDDSHNPVCSFGIAGSEMNTEYPSLTTISEFGKKHQAHREKYSYYSDIEYLDNQKYLARIYIKNNCDFDGLQIYDDNYSLIGDLNVPKGSLIAGGDNEHLYIYTINNEKMKININYISL